MEDERLAFAYGVHNGGRSRWRGGALMREVVP